MSFIGSRPFVDICLNALSSEEQISLLSTIDNPSAQVSGYYKIYHAEDGFVQLQNQFPDYHKFYYVSLSFDWIMSSFHEGFLIRLDENDYGFLGFEKNNQNMIIASLRQLPGKNGEYNVLQEQLTTEEFRRVLNDLNDTPTALADKSDLKLYHITGDPTIESIWETFGEHVFYATHWGIKYLVRLERFENTYEAYVYPLGTSFHYVAELQGSSRFSQVIKNSNRVNEDTKLYAHNITITHSNGSFVVSFANTRSTAVNIDNYLSELIYHAAPENFVLHPSSTSGPTIITVNIALLDIFPPRLLSITNLEIGSSEISERIYSLSNLTITDVTDTVTEL